MKKIVLIGIALLASFLLINTLIDRYLDDTLNDFDLGEMLIGACGDNRQCQEAVRTHYPACQIDASEMDAEAYFQAADDVTQCINRKSGLDIEALMPDT